MVVTSSETTGRLDSETVPSTEEGSSEAVAASSGAGVHRPGIFGLLDRDRVVDLSPHGRKDGTFNGVIIEVELVEMLLCDQSSGMTNENFFSTTPPMIRPTPSKALSTALTTSLLLSFTSTSP